MFTTKNLIHGTTLLELLIALTISILIISAVTGIYLTTEKNFELQDALNAMQENAQAAQQLLENAIRNVGNTGCGRIQNQLITTPNTITIRAAAAENANVLFILPDNATIYTTPGINFKPGASAIISDCLTTEIFQIKTFNQDSQKIISTSPLKNHYAATASIALFQEETYFIAATGRKSARGQPISALYIKNSNNHKQELVEGINVMTVTKMAQALSVKLELSAVSEYPLKKSWFMYMAI